MITTNLILENRAGLHTRPAALIAEIATASQSKVQLCYNGQCADARSVMNLIMLGVPYKAEIELIVTGADEEFVSNTIRNLFINFFNEV